MVLPQSVLGGWQWQEKGREVVLNLQTATSYQKLQQSIEQLALKKLEEATAIDEQ